MSQLVFLLLLIATISRSGNINDAEEARWVVSKGNWGTLSSLSERNNKPFSEVISYADVNGRIFLYLMGKIKNQVSLTLSEASFHPTSNYEIAACGPEGSVDAEDPRCAKLVIQGYLAPCEDLCVQGKQALFDRHPEMEYWPKNHHFMVHELTPGDLWMISDFGGGSIITSQEFLDATPKHHPHYQSSNQVTNEWNFENLLDSDVPSWDKKVDRARWIVGNSLWGTVSTVSVRLNGKAWGNIRSVVDGSSLSNSTGKPIFYLPTPDPTNQDVQQSPFITLSFSEAALFERLNQEGEACGGLDAMNPLCARVVLVGKAIAISSRQQLKQIYKAFAKRHPLAPWLSRGGAHTGGSYFTIDVQEVYILDYFGGYTPVDVNDYLHWKPNKKQTHLRRRFSIRNPFVFEDFFYNLFILRSTYAIKTFFGNLIK